MNKKELKEIEQIILKEEKDSEGIVCEENARYRAYVNLKLKKQRGEYMCKNWIEIEDGKVKGVNGIFKKGRYVVCLDCEEIIKLLKKGTKKICSLVLNKRRKK